MKLTGLTYKNALAVTRSPRFPSKVIVGNGSSGWDEDEVQDWFMFQEMQKQN